MLIQKPNKWLLRPAGFPQAECRDWGPIKVYSALSKVFRFSNITGHQHCDSGLVMDNPQLAKASPQLSQHPDLIPSYCNPAFVAHPLTHTISNEKKKKRRGGVPVPKREWESKGEWERVRCWNWGVWIGTDWVIIVWCLPSVEES